MQEMIKQWNKHSNSIHFLSIVLCAGMICGILLSQWIESDIINRLSTGAFSTMIKDIEHSEFFISQFTTNIFLALILLFLGFSVIGMPFISFVIFTKGVQIGFSCAMYLITYQLKGMIGIILTLIPQVTFDAIAIFIMSIVAFELSFDLFKRVFINTKAIQWKRLLDEKLNGIIISFILILFSSIIKSTVVIFLMEIFALIQ